MQKILVVAVHPDDETLGCGGTLLKHKAQGDEIHWLIVTAMTAECGFTPEAIARRAREIETVAQMYDFDSVHHLGFPAARLDEVPMSQLVAAISKVFQSVQPNQVFLPFQHDVHSDHQHAFAAAYSCTKSFRYPSVRKVMMVETLSETDFAQSASGGFVPNMFVDVSDQFERKMEVLLVYQSELRPHPFPRSEESITALATLRGAAAGCKYAESFMVLKEIA
ncbi:MAG: PIG-L deacetylase family protein [Gallionella sp.]|nr:PIG-L deacetylase family protein [Gallionella sp.]